MQALRRCLALDYLTPNLVVLGLATADWTASGPTSGTFAVTLGNAEDCGGAAGSTAYAFLSLRIRGSATLRVTMTGGDGCKRWEYPVVSILRSRGAGNTAYYIAHGPGDGDSGTNQCANTGALIVTDGAVPADIPVRCGDALVIEVRDDLREECPELSYSFAVEVL